MPADQIFVLVLVVGILLLLGWLSWETRRRSQVEVKRQAEAAAVPQIPIDTVKAPVRGRDAENVILASRV